MFNYSNVTSRDFECIVHEYLQSTYPGSSWNLTKSTGDGNRDVELSFQFLDQQLEYWAEAKFTRSDKSHKLQKSQLDPTLLSAMLYSKPVFIKFVSNNQAPDNYYYRLTDFKIKTNIGVTMVLRDEFESWLLENPNVCKRYGIKRKGIEAEERSNNYSGIVISDALITNEINIDGYSLERKLIQGNTYFLYVLIRSNRALERMSIQFQSPCFQFLSDSSTLLDPCNFSITQGTKGYKFRFLINEQFSGDLCISLWKDCELIYKYHIPEVSVVPSSNYVIAYAQQSKIEAAILEFARAKVENNRIALVEGSGGFGKSYLMDNLYRELSRSNDTQYFRFSDNKIYNCGLFYSLLLYINIGDTRGYSTSSIKEAVLQACSSEKSRFLVELLNRGSTAPEKCIDFLWSKQQQHVLQLVFPQRNTMRRIIILDNIHKLESDSPEEQLLYQLLNEFSLLDNNQLIIATSRKPNTTHFDFHAVLNGLSRNDKITSLKYYFNDIPNNITFHRSTDSVLTFSNILRKLIEETHCKKPDSLKLMAQIKHQFEHVENRHSNEYQSYLTGFLAYNNVIDLVFTVESGIPYMTMIKLYAPDVVDYLIEQNIFKLIGNRVYPFHDHYVSSYMSGKNMSSQTVSDLEELVEYNPAEAYIYLALLLKRGNALFFSKIEKARKMRDRFFSQSKLHESYLLSQAIVDHINFDEPLDADEVYDVYILANSSFYTKDCDEVIALYKQVIEHGRKCRLDSVMWGILLRTRTELMNQYYWDLDLEKLRYELQIADNLFPIGSPNDHEIVRAACIHRINRRMVYELLIGKYEAARTDYEYCTQEALRLNHAACRGYAEMDFGKGLYLVNMHESLVHMEEAQRIFDEIGTEHRRQLDCACEVAFLRCMVYGDSPENFHALESAAIDLYHAHYEEIYAKAKLKLAALHLCSDEPNLKSAETEIIEAEYVLSFRPSKRLKMIFSNVKSVYYLLSGQKSEAQKSLKLHNDFAQMLGSDYNAISKENMLVHFPQQAAFFQPGISKLSTTIWVDPRIW